MQREFEKKDSERRRSSERKDFIRLDILITELKVLLNKIGTISYSN